MDNTYYEQDKEDLERFRKGLPPLKRKEIILDPSSMLTPQQAAQKVAELWKISQTLPTPKDDHLL